MNLRQIEVFHAVYMAGSISGASRRLNVSQPSVSKVIKHAEAGLGFKLFTLAKGRLSPTEEAHLLFRDVADLHARIDVFNQGARNLRTAVAGHMRIGVLPSLALAFTPKVVARFRTLHPGVSFEISAIQHDSFLHVLESRECDFVIGHQLIFSADVEAVALGQGRVGALFQPGALQETMRDNGPAVSVDALCGKEIVGLADGVAIGAITPAEIFSGRPAPSLVARSVFIAAALARHSGAIAIVDEFTAMGYADGRLLFRPLVPDVQFELVALHLAAQPLSRIAHRFLDLKRTMIAEISH
ncbi:LysR family transcriptional regulator [Polymorphobacter multimanifer]|uniref:DNA-binding transcriptional LysR family regulator n=1 Tax=Polymorphobacter multimanifer TaxID=1070431 RepID=A0A841L971_9SPHN|nr:LysR family transcriptional regulator [Polymorphobacter multimanifer]MBB6228716.1 DNA-binding transcriptional LysR family regulator [Polymorphobacter multimanifer]GGI83665.1 LysR family transcriptional regulator [Polymorphobacter multimanifer]